MRISQATGNKYLLVLLVLALMAAHYKSCSAMIFVLICNFTLLAIIEREEAK